MCFRDSGFGMRTDKSLTKKSYCTLGLTANFKNLARHNTGTKVFEVVFACFKLRKVCTRTHVRTYA